MKQALHLGNYIVADPMICHGKPSFKGSRVMVWQVLEALAEGESHEEIMAAWPGCVSREAILEAIRLSGEAFLAHACDPIAA
jgi:uncharacterized protein (DUF433 family)